MDDNERMNDRQLALIREFSSICAADSIDYWLRGGWAMDFFLGRITREHHDIDLLVWAKDAPRLMERLWQAEFEEMGGAPPEEQRNVTKNGEELQIVPIDRNERGDVVLAGGPWAGTAWPDGVIDGPPGQLGDLVCPIMNPRVQIEVKEKFRVWRPDLPPRETDQEDIAHLRAALSLDS